MHAVPGSFDQQKNEKRSEHKRINNLKMEKPIEVEQKQNQQPQDFPVGDYRDKMRIHTSPAEKPGFFKNPVSPF